MFSAASPLLDSDDDFEFVSTADVAHHIASEKRPDLDKIKAWLHPADYNAATSEFNRHLSSQAPGTGEWIRSTPQFAQWHSSPHHGSIWIKAVPGAGKSVVAASMVDSLARQENVPVLFFFFRQIIETNHTARELLRDWMSQLLPLNEVLQVALWDMVEERTQLESVSTTTLWKIMLSALAVGDRVYCIVDALDEMSFDEEFLQQLNALGSFRPAHVKILMTSRPKQYLQTALKDPQVIHVSLEEELVKRDIALFVQQRVKEFGKDGLNEEIHDAIQRTVCDRSEGLFLYARLMLDQIADSVQENSHNAEALRDVVTRLPVGLEEMYNQVLFDHAEQTNVTQDLQLFILKLVTHAARPMRLIEIASALEEISGVLTNSKDAKEMVRVACGPLLDIMEDEVVQIIHHSFTEFLLDSSRLERATTQMPQFPVIESSTAHRDIALVCLAYLQSGVFEGYPEKDEEGIEGDGNANFYLEDESEEFDFRPIFLKHPLAAYAARKWPYHAKNYDVHDQEFFQAMEHFVRPQALHYRAWTDLMCKGGDACTAFRKVTQLHVAAGYGLTSWTAHLIKNGADLDALDSSENSALYWAAQHGHTETVDMLLMAGAKPNIDGSSGLTPMHVAASRNHVDVVKLLLTAGVPPTTPRTKDVGGMFCGNAPSSIGEEPILYAAQAGHVETILEMIPHLTSEKIEMALCCAARRGHIKLATTLFENTDVSPDAAAPVRWESINNLKGGETVLMLAVKSMDPNCVKLFLGKGASVHKTSTRDLDYNTLFLPGSGRKLEAQTPLHTLAQMTINEKNLPSAKEILNMLLAAGADLEAKDGKGDTPLMLSLGQSRLLDNSAESVDLFLSAGADPCTMDSKGETLLHRVCQTQSSTEVLEKLLKAEADPNQGRLSDGATAVHCLMKSTRANKEHIELLLAYGADFNARDHEGNTPFHILCSEQLGQTEKLMPYILALNPQVNLQNNKGMTGLHLFTASRPLKDKTKEIYHSIIDAGADPEIYDLAGHTVLLWAAARGEDPTMQALLSYPGDRKAPNTAARTLTEGKTALHLVCQKDYPGEMIETLVDAGADVRNADSAGNTLLHELAARFEGLPRQTKAIKRLVQLGVSPSAINNRRQTAAHIISLPDPKNSYSSDGSTRDTFVSVIRSLDSGFDIDAPDIDGFTPLHYAAATSEAATYNLIQAGASMNARANDLRTPLHTGARGRQSSILAMMVRLANHLGQVLDVNAVDKEGRTALHEAVRSGRPESVTILVEAGADVNLKDCGGWTPLMFCAKFKQENAIWEALRNPWESGLSIQDDFRRVHVPLALHDRHTEEKRGPHRSARVGSIVQMLIKAGAETKDTIDFGTRVRCPELIAGARSNNQNGKPRTLDECLLMAQWDHAAAVVDASIPYDKSTDFDPVNLVSINGAIMDRLVLRGVDFTRYWNHETTTAMHDMARHGLTELLSKVIDKAKVFDDPSFTNTMAADKLTSPESVCPLLFSACHRRLWNMDMVKLLVTEGKIDVNARQQVEEPDPKGWGKTGRVIPGGTALHVLAEGNYWWQPDAIQYLVENGADLNALDHQGRTPLEIASTHHKHNILQKRGFFKPRCCEVLLELGADPNRVNHKGETAFHMAASDPTVQTILKMYGADIHAGTRNRLLPAIESKDVSAVKECLDSGANPNVPDPSPQMGKRVHANNGIQHHYALVWAALPVEYDASNIAIAAEMVKLLLDHGANVNLPISEDKTIIHHIFEKGPTPVLRCFVERTEIDFNICDQRGRNVFMAACENLRVEKPRAFELLLESEAHGPKINYLAFDNKRHSILNYLQRQMNEQLWARIRVILGIKSLVLSKDAEGFSPLHHALRENKEFPYNVYLDAGADIIEPDPNGDTAIHHLSRCHDMSELNTRKPLIDEYLAKGGDINARNNVGETALLAHLAVTFEPSRWGLFFDEPLEFDVTQNLPFYLERGADVRAVKNDGETALHVVARRPIWTGWLPRDDMNEFTFNAELFKRLVELGCDPLQEDKDGKTALDVADVMGNTGILELFQRKKET